MNKWTRALDRVACVIPWPRRPHTFFFNLRPAPGGPGTFARKLQRVFEERDIDVDYRRLRSTRAALLFSKSWGQWFLYLCRRWHIRTVLRVDGFMLPAYFDNRPQLEGYQDRRLGFEAMRYNYRLQRDLALADFVIYQSAFSKHMADQYLYNRRRDYDIVFNGVDLRHFVPGPTRAGRRRLLVAGFLRDEYMLGTVLPAFERLWRDFDLELLIVGSLAPICLQQLREFSTHNPAAFDRVQVTGSIDNDDMAVWMQQADVLVHPRLGDWCPNVVIEALACGLPVVCGSWGGAGELVGDGGQIVQTDEWSYGERFITHIVLAVREILARLDEYRLAARERAVRNFNIHDVTDAYLQALGMGRDADSA